LGKSEGCRGKLKESKYTEENQYAGRGEVKENAPKCKGSKMRERIRLETGVKNQRVFVCQWKGLKGKRGVHGGKRVGKKRKQTTLKQLHGN